MNVAYFLTYDYSLHTWDESGTLQRELKILEKLKDNGMKFTLITYGDKKDLMFDDVNEIFEVIPVYDHIKYFNNKILRLIYSFTIPFKIQHLLKDTKILKQNQLSGAWISIILKKLLKIPLFIRTGYDTYLFSIKEDKGIVERMFFKLLTKISLKNADIYTVTSEDDINFLNNEFKINSNKIFLIRNWVDIDKNINFNDRIENKILCVGRLVPQKNYFFLIDAISNVGIENIEIDIYGKGPLEKDLKNYAEIKKVKLNIFKNISHEALLEEYKKYKYFVIPSIYEGNPKSLLEAMANGCVVFASNIPNHNEIIEHKINGYVFDLNEGDLSQTFNEAFDDNSEIIQKNAYNLMKESYDFHKIKVELLEKIKSLN